MSSKYDLYKLLDPYEIDKIHKSIEGSNIVAMQAAMADIANPFKNSAAMQVAMAGIANPFKDQSAAMQVAMTGIANPFKDQSAAMQVAMAGITNPFKDQSAAMQVAMAGIANPFKDQSAAMAAKSLGLQVDMQKLIAAKTLMPDLNTKIFNLHQKLYAIAGLTKQRLNQNNFDSTHNYVDPFDEFNEKYNQDVHVDQTVIQTLDFVLHQPETLELTSELRNIGIFDTSSGSILLEYSETLTTSKASDFLNLIVCLLLWLSEPIINEYEPINNLQEKSSNFLNKIDGKAIITKDCELKVQPNGLKIMSLEKESLVIVYKNEDILDGWSKIKFNKDGHDVTGYIKTAEFNLLD